MHNRNTDRIFLEPLKPLFKDKKVYTHYQYSVVYYQQVSHSSRITSITPPLPLWSPRSHTEPSGFQPFTKLLYETIMPRPRALDSAIYADTPRASRSLVSSKVLSVMPTGGTPLHPDVVLAGDLPSGRLPVTLPNGHGLKKIWQFMQSSISQRLFK